MAHKNTDAFIMDTSASERLHTMICHDNYGNCVHIISNEIVRIADKKSVDLMRVAVECQMGATYGFVYCYYGIALKFRIIHKR